MTSLHTFDRDVLRAAQYELERVGFTVSSPTPDLLADGIALTAYRVKDDFGALIAFPELGHIVHYGAVYLWGGDLESNPKPFKARDIRSRLESFVAKVCLSVSSTAPGQGARQVELSKAAYSIGGLAEGHGVDSEAFRGQLEQAGFASGLEPHRVIATVQTSLRAGIRKPWTLEDKPMPEKPKQNTGITFRGRVRL
jgi:hypothetical protein